jgi:hypothetical protein
MNATSRLSSRLPTVAYPRAVQWQSLKRLFLSDWAEKLGSRWLRWGQKGAEPLDERDIRAVGEGAVEAALFN